MVLLLGTRTKFVQPLKFTTRVVLRNGFVSLLDITYSPERILSTITNKQ